MKYIRTIIKIELLTEDRSALQIESLDLEQVVYEMTHGDASGKFTVESSIEVTGRKMAKLLKAQGSDPGFFQLDDEVFKKSEWRRQPLGR